MELNEDGTKNEEYYIYCFKNGEFTSDMSMDGMMNFCIGKMVEVHPEIDVNEASSMMKEIFPKLMGDRRLGMAEAPGSNPGQSILIYLINENCDLNMILIAQNHLQLILEIGIMIFILLVFILNLVPLSLSVVTFLSLFLAGGFTLLFGADIALLVVSSSQAEFTHPFGPIALLGAVTALASLKVMKTSGVDVRPLRRFVILFIAGITIFGGLMHRSFLLLWILGLFIGYTILSKSFREKSIFTAKRILIFLGVAVAGFLSLEVIARVSGMTIFSPMLRLGRIEQYSTSSVKMVLNNIQLIGHNGNASYWGAEGTAFAEGYITLPMQLVLFFGLPFPMFFGILVNQKDTVDYMLPGILGYGFDFGYLGLIGLVVFVLGTIIIGFKILAMYREKREKNSKKYLGKEVLLTGALAAFCSQSLIGLFIFNRTINGTALLSFMFLGCLILANAVTLKSRT